MESRVLVVSTGHLVSDDGSLTAVEFSVALATDRLTGRTRASGWITGDLRSAEKERNLQAPSLVTQHFGTILIQIHDVGQSGAAFTITEAFEGLSLDPPWAPPLAAIDAEALPVRISASR